MPYASMARPWTGGSDFTLLMALILTVSPFFTTSDPGTQTFVPSNSMFTMAISVTDCARTTLQEAIRMLVPIATANTSPERLLRAFHMRHLLLSWESILLVIGWKLHSQLSVVAIS